MREATIGHAYIPRVTYRGLMMKERVILGVDVCFELIYPFIYIHSLVPLQTARTIAGMHEDSGEKSWLKSGP